MATSSPAQVRPARPDDVEPLLALRERVAREGIWIGTEAPVDAERELTVFSATLDADDRDLFVAIVDCVLVGGLGVQFTTPGVTALGMQIDREWRGRGIGSALMDAAVAWSRAHDAHKMELQVWPHNAAAIALYEKFGFEREGYLRRHYRRRSGELWDAIVMGLVLDTTSPGSSLHGSSTAGN